MKTRRQFLKTLGGLGLLTILPRNVLGRGFIAPSDQLTKGIIGVGGVLAGIRHDHVEGVEERPVADGEVGHDDPHDDLADEPGDAEVLRDAVPYPRYRVEDDQHQEYRR